jgi:hypothetical protein
MKIIIPPNEENSGDLLSSLHPYRVWENTEHPTSGKHVPKAPSLDDYDYPGDSEEADAEAEATWGMGI